MWGVVGVVSRVSEELDELVDSVTGGSEPVGPFDEDVAVSVWRGVCVAFGDEDEFFCGVVVWVLGIDVPEESVWWLGWHGKLRC